MFWKRWFKKKKKPEKSETFATASGRLRAHGTGWWSQTQPNNTVIETTWYEEPNDKGGHNIKPSDEHQNHFSFGGGNAGGAGASGSWDNRPDTSTHSDHDPGGYDSSSSSDGGSSGSDGGGGGD